MLSATCESNTSSIVVRMNIVDIVCSGRIRSVKMAFEAPHVSAGVKCTTPPSADLAGTSLKVTLRFCLVPRVVTPGSLLMSDGLVRCHSGAISRRLTIAKPASTERIRITRSHSLSFRFFSGRELTRKRSMVRVHSGLPFNPALWRSPQRFEVNMGSYTPAFCNPPNWRREGELNPARFFIHNLKTGSVSAKLAKV